MVTNTLQNSKTHFVTFNFDGAKNNSHVHTCTEHTQYFLYCPLKAVWNNKSISSGNVINVHKHANNTTSEYSPVTSPCCNKIAKMKLVQCSFFIIQLYMIMAFFFNYVLLHDNT
jgi:hypothetical protein